MKSYVDADLALGRSMGVQSTPTIIIGDTMITGLRDYETYRQLTLDELARVGVVVD